MAKRRLEEVEDDEDGVAVSVDTSLNTHILLLVSPNDTISLLKQKILLEHPKCFPDFGEIQINALKVKRREYYYHIVDSMFVKTAFYKVAKEDWFLFADLSSQISMLTPSSDHAVITAEPSKTLPILVTSSKHLESGINCNEVDPCRNYFAVNKGLGLEMPNKIVSGVQDEFKSAEEAKNDKKKRKRTHEHNDNGGEDAPSQNKNTIHAIKNSVIGSMELGTKVKKGKVSIQENTDLPSMETNKDSATCILSIGHGHVENEKNEDLSDKADRDDGTHQTDKKINRVKTVSIFSLDGDQEADDGREIGAEPLQSAEINKPSVSLEIRDKKTKRKTQKKQTVSMKDSPDFSVKERSGEKTTDADTLKVDDVNILVDGDLYKDTNKTPLPEISLDVAEARKTKRRSSKKKVKKQDLPSSVDTLYDMDSSKANISGRTSCDDTKLKEDDPEALGTKDLQPPSLDKAEESSENIHKSKKKTGKKRTASKDPPPMSPMKERFDEETREKVVPKTGGAALVDDCNEKLDEIRPSDSTGLREVRNQDKPHTSVQVVKKLNLPSTSVDTLSIEPSLSKSKKSKKGEKTSENETQLKESITVQKQDMPQPQPSEKPSETFKKGIETQEPHVDPIESMAKLAGNDIGIGSPNRKTPQGKKIMEPQKKPVENPVCSTRSTLKKMGEVINNTSPQKKGLLATGGAIFEDESSESSDDGDKIMDGSVCSTRTPSDNLSSSDYSEGESKGNVVTSQHDSLKSGGQDCANSKSLDFKNLTLHTVLRNSIRYKKAKVLASQSQLDDTESPLDVVPDSQANH